MQTEWENLHTVNPTKRTQQGTFRDTYVYINTYKHAIKINEIQGHEFEEGGEGYMVWFGGRKEKKEIL